jgi:transcriptional regulator with XRE-family HTH domain
MATAVGISHNGNRKQFNHINETREVPMTKKVNPVAFKNWRVSKGYKQSDVADRFGHNVRTIRNWEGGRSEVPLYVAYLVAADEAGLVPADVMTSGATTLDADGLRQWRKGKGISQEDLAETLGVDPRTVYRWEGGKDGYEPPRWVPIAIAAIEGGLHPAGLKTYESEAA